MSRIKIRVREEKEKGMLFFNHANVLSNRTSRPHQQDPWNALSPQTPPITVKISIDPVYLGQNTPWKKGNAIQSPQIKQGCNKFGKVAKGYGNWRGDTWEEIRQVLEETASVARQQDWRQDIPCTITKNESWIWRHWQVAAKSLDSKVQLWRLNLSSFPISCVTLGKWLTYTKSQFRHL